MKKKIITGILALGIGLPIAANADFLAEQKKQFQAIKEGVNARATRKLEKIIVTNETENNKYGTTKIEKIYSNGDTKEYFESFVTKKYLSGETFKTDDGKIVNWYTPKGERATVLTITEKDGVKTTIDVYRPNNPEERDEERIIETVLADGTLKKERDIGNDGSIESITYTTGKDELGSEYTQKYDWGADGHIDSTSVGEYIDSGEGHFKRTYTVFDEKGNEIPEKTIITNYRITQLSEHMTKLESDHLKRKGWDTITWTYERDDGLKIIYKDEDADGTINSTRVIKRTEIDL